MCALVDQIRIADIAEIRIWYVNIRRVQPMLQYPLYIISVGDPKNTSAFSI